MRTPGYAALFAAGLAGVLAATPAAKAGDFFINGQAGRINLDGDRSGDDEASLTQASAGYRWGIGMAQVGLEAGLGQLGGTDGDSRRDYAGGYVDSSYSMDSRYGFVGLNARIKPPLVPVYGIGRAGYVAFRHELDSTSIDHYLDTSPVTQRSTFDETEGGTYVGIGVGTTILPMLDVGLMVNQFRSSQVRYDAVEDEYRLSDDKRDARSVTLTAEYRF